MLATLVSKFMAWLGGRGLRILVRQIADALEEAEVDRDYKLAMQELALMEAQAGNSARDAEAHRRMNDVEIGTGASDDAVIERLRKLADKPAKS